MKHFNSGMVGIVLVAVAGCLDGSGQMLVPDGGIGKIEERQGATTLTNVSRTIPFNDSLTWLQTDSFGTTKWGLAGRVRITDVDPTHTKVQVFALGLPGPGLINVGKMDWVDLGWPAYDRSCNAFAGISDWTAIAPFNTDVTRMNVSHPGFHFCRANISDSNDGFAGCGVGSGPGEMPWNGTYRAAGDGFEENTAATGYRPWQGFQLSSPTAGLFTLVVKTADNHSADGNISPRPCTPAMINGPGNVGSPLFMGTTR